ncbi:hypothetical protein [Acidithrix ferrooxidans]|uniref:Transposase IS116/IS110/IS902 family protein n=1 Tax=Acidithrix ferrooxidans TaxID=1280514 RepID=A0A0D8HEF2_9ACTN|nr:hypothetical protein [Acidithrix ferrooxidans]KJF16182.1 hypothetical protein AXFE_29830 [Acidithrix ferrooxidans]
MRRLEQPHVRRAHTTQPSYLTQYLRITKRRGANKAPVAVAHSILDTLWHLLTNGTLYVDPGADYFDRRCDPAIQAKKLASRIEALGFEVTMTQAVA